MKKLAASLLFLLALVLSIPAQAQIRMGLSGGITMNKVELDGALKQISRNYTGWYAGPTLEVGVPIVPIKLDVSAMYAYNGATIGGLNDQPHHINCNYISVPVNLKLHLGLGSLAALYVSAGPQFDYNLSDNVVQKNDTDRTPEMAVTATNKFTVKKRQLSVNVGGGFRFFDQFQLGLYYNIPCGGDSGSAEVKDLSDGSTKPVQNFTFKNNMWKLNLLVFF